MLYAGVSKSVITPNRSCELAGFAARVQPCLGVLEDVYVRALVLAEGQSTYALVVCDLLGFEPAFDRHLRWRLRAEADLEGVILSCTHTHSAPASMPLIGCGQVDEVWRGELLEKVVETVLQAKANCQPVEFFWGKGTTTIAMNRRRWTGERTLLLGLVDELALQAGPVDRDLILLQWRSLEGQPIATLVHCACHPVSLGHENRYISQDFPGFTLSALREKGLLGEILFLQGCCGDLNPAIYQRGEGECRRIGVQLAEDCLKVVEQFQPSKTSPIRFMERDLELSYRNPPVEAEPVRVNSSALLLGEVALVTLPGEPFCELGMEIKKASPVECTLVAGYANGNAGYLPTRSEYPRGGYEVEEAYKYYGYPDCWAPSVGESLVANALEMIQSLKGV